MSVTPEDNLQEPDPDEGVAPGDLEPAPEQRRAPRPAPVKKAISGAYRLYAEAEDGVLHPLGVFKGDRAEDAIGNWSDENPDEDMDGIVFVPIAVRNFSRVTAQIQRTTRLVKVEE